MAAPVNGSTPTLTFKNDYIVVEDNDEKLAIFGDKPLVGENLSIDLKDHIIMFLTPLEASANITINALSVVALSTLTAKAGVVAINVPVDENTRVILFNGPINSHLKSQVNGRIAASALPEEKLKTVLEMYKKGLASKHVETICEALDQLVSIMETYGGNLREDTFELV